MNDSLVLDDVPLAQWSDFHRGEGGPGGELEVAWRRAATLGAPHEDQPPERLLLGGRELVSHRESLELVRTLGQQVLGRATAQVSEHHHLLLLADAQGVVVSASGGGHFADPARAMRLIAGACWSEEARGTNAIGTAARLGRATVVRGRAHFARRYHELVCYAAPVRDPSGAPLAVLDATSHVAADRGAVGELVLGAARALEEVLRLHAYASAGASITRMLGRTLDHLREPALLVETPGQVVRANAAARILLGARSVGGACEQALGVPWPELVRAVLSGVDPELELGAGAERRVHRLRLEPVAAPGGLPIAVLVRLEPVATLARAGGSLCARAADPFAPIFAEDAAVVAAIDWARRLAHSGLPVMLRAETGAGKELFAQAIHAASDRRAGPFVAVNCGALTPSLLESELFGYAPGAFTGAERAGRAGLLQSASGGTLFLDEVAEMPPTMQATLLRVLETGTYRRVGDVEQRRTDVRVVCASCRDLTELVRTGEFRQDLYYRLAGATVRIPPLRERTDLVALAHHLLARRDVALRLAPETEAVLRQHPWPGNVRELASALAVAAVSAAPGTTLLPSHFPPELAPAQVAAEPASLAGTQRSVVQRALALADGNISRAAKQLGVARSTLYRMLRRHGLG